MAAKKEIVYLKHPVTAEEKEKAVNAGKKILDIKFKPKAEKKEAK